MEKRNIKIIAISIIITVAWILFIMLGVFDQFDLKIMDFFMVNSPALEQDSNIVVVEYDDKTAENLVSPATKPDLAALVQIIEEYKPRVLALDLFSMYGLLYREDSEMLFEDIISQYDNICYGIGFIVPKHKKNGTYNGSGEFNYLNGFLYSLEKFSRRGSLYHAEHLFKPANVFYTKSNSIGHLVLKNDMDGVFRRIPAIIECGSGALATLGLQAGFNYLALKKDNIKILNKKIFVESEPSIEIPIDNKAQIIIRYNDTRDKIKEISMIDVFSTYKNPDNGLINLEFFRDKLVFIGNTSSRTARFCATPLHSYYPTILMHANVANNLLQHSFLIYLSKSVLFILLIILGILYTLPMLYSKEIFKASVALVALIPIIITLGYILAILGNLYIPLFTLASYILFLFCCLIFYRYLDYKNSLLISLKDIQEAMRLKERLAFIGELSSKVAHEIRNPLNSIEIYTSLLKRSIEDRDDAREYLNIIHEETQRLNRFITRLLEYARPKEPTLKTLNLKSEINSAIKLISPDTNKKGIRIICTVPDNTEILADSDQMHEIFINLAKNSIEAMSKEGILEIYSRTERTSVSIFFKDNGKGIPKDDQNKIFNPFYSTGKHGTGLGLAMVKKIVESHRGEIIVKSEPKKGTLIEIKLPYQHGKRKKGETDEKI